MNSFFIGLILFLALWGTFDLMSTWLQFYVRSIANEKARIGVSAHILPALFWSLFYILVR